MTRSATLSHAATLGGIHHGVVRDAFLRKAHWWRRARAGDRVVYGVEGRIGWELHVRVNGFIGFRFGQ
jgi:hypothetical protein